MHTLRIQFGSVLLGCLAQLFMCAVAAADVRMVRLESGDRNIAPQLAYYETDSIDDDLSVINRPNLLREFSVDGKRSMSRGFGTGSLWAVIDLKNQSDVNDWYVVLSYPLLDEVDVWVEGVDGTLQRSERVGDSRPFVSREIKTPQLVVPINLQRNEVSRLFLRIKTNGSFYAPIHLHRGVFDSNSCRWRHSIFILAASSDWLCIILFSCLFPAVAVPGALWSRHGHLVSWRDRSGYAHLILLTKAFVITFRLAMYPWAHSASI